MKRRRLAESERWCVLGNALVVERMVMDKRAARGSKAWAGGGDVMGDIEKQKGEQQERDNVRSQLEIIVQKNSP